MYIYIYIYVLIVYKVCMYVYIYIILFHVCIVYKECTGDRRLGDAAAFVR